MGTSLTSVVARKDDSSLFFVFCAVAVVLAATVVLGLAHKPVSLVKSLDKHTRTSCIKLRLLFSVGMVTSD